MNYRRALALTTGCLLLGCDTSAPPQPPAVVNGPHHGLTIRLPDDKGFVEVVNEPEIRDRRDNSPTAIVAYFLQADGKSSLSPAPTGVSVVPLADRTTSTAIPLASEPKADDLAGAARFASKPGAYQLVTFRGKLTATIGGQPISVDIAGSR